MRLSRGTLGRTVPLGGGGVGTGVGLVDIQMTVTQSGPRPDGNLSVAHHSDSQTAIREGL